MAKCLVLGGNGFLGSHLVDQLVAGGHEVTAFDRFGRAPIAFEAQGVAIVSGDFMRVSDVTEAVRGHDIVFHFVSMTDPASAEPDPMMDVRTNLVAGIELFRACADAGIRRLVFASTGGAIYGDQDLEVYDETAPTRPVSPYAIGKLALEGYLRYFSRMAGLRSVVVRISNPYGPRQDPSKRQGVIPIFLNALARDQPLTVYGDGTMVRDYIYVEDAVAMVVAVGTGQPRHDIYNIGSGVGVSVSHLVSTVASVTGRQPMIEWRPKPPSFVDHVVLDISRLKGEFECPPVRGLQEGVLRTWRSLRRAT